MKKFTLAAFILLAGQTAFANNAVTDPSDHSGFYLGFDVAPYQHNLPEGTAFKYQPFLFPETTYQVQAGYQFTRHFGLEGNYLNFYNGSSDGYTENGVFQYAPDHLKVYGFDLLGKASYPVNRFFSVYAEAGAAYVYEDNYNVPFAGFRPAVDYKTSNVMPVAGAGVSVYPTHWLSIDASYKHYFSTGRIGSFNIVPIGLSVHF